MSTAIVSDVARPGGEPLCPSCKGGEGSKSKATAGGDGNLKEYRYVCVYVCCSSSSLVLCRFFWWCSYASSGRLVSAIGRQLGWVPYFDGFVGVFTVLFGGWLAKFWSVLYDEDGKPRKGAAAEDAVRIVALSYRYPCAAKFALLAVLQVDCDARTVVEAVQKGSRRKNAAELRSSGLVIWTCRHGLIYAYVLEVPLLHDTISVFFIG